MFSSNYVLCQHLAGTVDHCIVIYWLAFMWCSLMSGKTPKRPTATARTLGKPHYLQCVYLIHLK